MHSAFLTMVGSVALMLFPAAAVAQDLPAPPAKPALRDFIGLNVHTVMFKPDLYKPVSRMVRDYPGFDWDVGNETDFYLRFPFERIRLV
jgi:hypothetical protein